MNKEYQPDFVCYNEVVVEIKAISNLSGIEEAQLINYLKATSIEVGLLINFGETVEIKRKVLDHTETSRSTNKFT